ncbi:transporter substrate-binding domain-containing protein [Pseudodesulfovibrio sp. JC047]|uniref:transporter substrate-binding domain-containing protein n=1 Tax=Pseudodesulfovibrio sp. JC047 TaxID=2683199 RepID=UPI0013D488F8|nr:transporter substrate-binding domain-containing protein [Pseudodesulfovibrio sp. JC047]
MDGTSIDGIDIRLVTALLQEIGYTPRFVPCPWIRGVAMIETGDADIISGILKRQDRENTMIFLEPPYKTRSAKVFYLRNNTPDIIHYTDLSHRSIGTQRGAQYFEQFDSDTSLNKQPIHNNALNFKKLISGRINTIIVTESIGDYLIAELHIADKVKKATFRYDSVIPVYFALSKKSSLVQCLPQLLKANRLLKESGAFDRIIDTFFERLHQPATPDQ